MKKLLAALVCLAVLISAAAVIPKQDMKSCLEENVYGCSSDGDCISKAQQFCSQFLEEGCEFGLTGVVCENEGGWFK
jgi:hypothetical protein